MKIKIIFCCIIFVTTNFSIYGTNIDSLKSLLKLPQEEKGLILLLQEVTNYYFDKNLDSVELYLNKTLEASSDLNHPSIHAKNYILEGSLYQQRNLPEKADSLYRLGRQIYMKLNNREGIFNSTNSLAGLKLNTGSFQEAVKFYKECLDIEELESLDSAMIFHNLGITYQRLGKFDSSFENSFKALEIYEKAKEFKYLGGLYMSLGSTYHAYSLNNQAISELDKAIYYQKEAIKIGERIKSIETIAKANANLGAYYSKDQPDSALFYFQKAYEFAQEINNPSLETSIALDLGITYSRLGQFEKALSYYINQQKNVEEGSDIGAIAGFKYNLGYLSQELGDFKMAINYFNEALLLAEEMDYKRMEESLLLMLSHSHKELGDYKKAYNIQKRRQFLRDTLLNEQKDEAIRTLEVKYQTKIKDQKIELLDNQKQAAQANANRNLLLFIISLLTITFIVFIYLRERKVKLLTERLRRAETHRTENNYLRISMELEDQIALADNEAAKIALTKGRSLIETSAIIHQILKQEPLKNNEFISISKHIHKLCSNLKPVFSDMKNLKMNVVCDENILINHKAIQPLLFIIDELVTNSWKHAFKNHPNPEISLCLRKVKDSHLQITYNDNGVGLIDNAKSIKEESQGLEIIRSFTSSLGGKMTVDSINGFFVNFDFLKPGIIL